MTQKNGVSMMKILKRAADSRFIGSRPFSRHFASFDARGVQNSGQFFVLLPQQPFKGRTKANYPLQDAFLILGQNYI